MVNFLRRLALYWKILWDRQTPIHIKLILALGLLYLIIPMDLITDTIPVLGLLDDVTVASALIALALRLMPSAPKPEDKKRKQ